MEKRLLYPMFCCLAVIAVISLAFSVYAGEPKLDLKQVSISPSGTPQFARMDEWPAKKVEEVTNGRVKFTNYPSGTLISQRDTYSGIQRGVADFGWIYSAYTPGVFSVDELFALPGLFPNMATANAVMNILYEKFPHFEKQFHPDVVRISSHIMLRPGIHSVVPVRTLADLKGLVVGCQDPTSAKALSKAGASASVLPIHEMYTSAERGVIKAGVVAWGALGQRRLDEVFKYHTLVYLSPSTSHYLFNKNTWNKFTKEEREKISLLGPWFQRCIMEGAAMPGEAVRKKITAQKGHEFISWSDQDMKSLRGILRPMWDEWAKKMEGKGIPGKEILKEAERLLEMYGNDMG
ncbi:MAG: TRAP transporter substrate-binding protein DctP [Deltaproteobacteria bacterium]|nr:TRAP transporter substrate-binding protein DctP [Deltaproteobacteria bacterium]